MPASADQIERRGAGGPEVRFADDVTPESRSDVTSLLAEWDPGLFPGPRTEVSVLVGGANNRNFIVRSGAAKYALRVANLQNERFAVDRESAIAAQRKAAEDGLAPEVVAARLPEGHMLSVFIEGETLLGTERLEQPEVLAMVGRTFRRLHALSAEVRTYSPFDDIRLWAGLARRDGSDLPHDFDEMLRLVDRIEEAILRCELPLVLSHNDTVPQNFILSEDGLRLVDWDYAGLGWACFELGSFAATAGFDAERREALLRSYDEDVNDEQRARVEVLGLVAAVREVSWVLMATPILKGNTTPDEESFYEDYLRENSRRVRAMIDSDRFQDRLASSSAWSAGLAW